MAPVQPLIALLKTEVDEPSQVMLVTVEEHLGMQLLEVTVFHRTEFALERIQQSPQNQE